MSPPAPRRPRGPVTKTQDPQENDDIRIRAIPIDSLDARAREQLREAMQEIEQMLAGNPMFSEFTVNGVSAFVVRRSNE